MSELKATKENLEKGLIGVICDRNKSTVKAVNDVLKMACEKTSIVGMYTYYSVKDDKLSFSDTMSTGLVYYYPSDFTEEAEKQKSATNTSLFKDKTLPIPEPEHSFCCVLDNLITDVFGDVEKPQEVLDEVLQEVTATTRKFGEQNHSPAEWIAIIGEEFGEASKECVEYTHAGQKGIATSESGKTDRAKAMRKELIQLANVTVKAINSLDRNELKTETETTWDNLTYNVGDTIYVVHDKTLLSGNKGVIKEIKTSKCSTVVLMIRNTSLSFFADKNEAMKHSETILKPVKLFTTVDGKDIYKDDEVYFVFNGDIGTSKKGAMEQFTWGSDYIELYHEATYLEWYGSKVNAESFAKKILWKSDAVYMVRGIKGCSWELKYSSDKVGRFYLRQNKVGGTVGYLEYRLCEGIESID